MIGKIYRYEKENEDEVRDKKQYLPEDIESSKKYTNMAPFLKRMIAYY